VPATVDRLFSCGPTSPPQNLCCVCCLSTFELDFATHLCLSVFTGLPFVCMGIQLHNLCSSPSSSPFSSSSPPPLLPADSCICLVTRWSPSCAQLCTLRTACMHTVCIACHLPSGNNSIHALKHTHIRTDIVLQWCCCTFRPSSMVSGAGTRQGATVLAVCATPGQY